MVVEEGMTTIYTAFDIQSCLNGKKIDYSAFIIKNFISVLYKLIY